MTRHPLDEATALERRGPEHLVGRTSPAYANMGGPFGGFTAAVLMRAVLEDQRRRGDPVALTVNYCAAIADGPFEVVCRERRTGKSTQHWSLELTQEGRVAATASVVCGARRPVWSHQPARPPSIPEPDTLPAFAPHRDFGWLQRYEFRFAKGEVDFAPGNAKELREPVSLLWLRDRPARPLDFIALAALSDAFIIRAFVVRCQFVPLGTVTLTTFFHADEAALREQGTDYLLGLADAHVFAGGFADQMAQLWSRDRRLLATSTQVVWYKA